MTSTIQFTKPSIDDDEKILRVLMLADCAVLRRRLRDTQYPAEVKAAIRAARQRQTARNHQQKSQPAVSPATTQKGHGYA